MLWFCFVNLSTFVFKYFNFSTEKKKLFPWMWHCLSHHFLWASVIFVGLEFAEFVAKISNWNFFSGFFFPIETSLQKRIANQLTLNFKHTNSSFSMAFILLWQKREKLVICHQSMLLPKLPFIIGKLFTILESLPLRNKPTYSGWQSSCRLFAISTGFDFVFLLHTL